MSDPRPVVQCGCGLNWGHAGPHRPPLSGRSERVKVEEVREFARGLLAYEAEHAAGPETPTLIAVANDLLAIVGRDDAEQAPA